MQAKVNCRIDAINCDKDEIILYISSISGKVDTKMPSAQFIEFDGHIKLKPVMGNKLKIGSVIVLDITITDTDGEQK